MSKRHLVRFLRHRRKRTPFVSPTPAEPEPVAIDTPGPTSGDDLETLLHLAEQLRRKLALVRELVERKALDQ